MALLALQGRRIHWFWEVLVRKDAEPVTHEWSSPVLPDEPRLGCPPAQRREPVRTLLALMGALGILGACGDGPSALVAPEDARRMVPTATEGHVEAVRSAMTILEDPLVGELWEAVDAPMGSLKDAVRNAARHGTREDVLVLSGALAATRTSLLAAVSQADSDPEEQVLRATLVLVLDDAASLLELPPRDRRTRATWNALHH